MHADLAAMVYCLCIKDKTFQLNNNKQAVTFCYTGVGFITMTQSKRDCCDSQNATKTSTPLKV